MIGGFVIIDVPSREEALDWAGRFAAACRCAQEVREIMYDRTGLTSVVPWSPAAHTPTVRVAA